MSENNEPDYRGLEWAADYVSGYNGSFRQKWHHFVRHLPYWLQLGLWDFWEPRKGR